MSSLDPELHAALDRAAAIAEAVVPLVPALAARDDSGDLSGSRVLDVFVPGRPAPQGSKRHVGNGRMIEMSKAVGPWRTTVAWSASQVWRHAPLDGPVVVHIQFVMPRPKNLPKRKPTPPHTKRPDVDKLARAVNDALSGVVWRDDSQIVDLHPTKRYAEIAEQPGALIVVREIAS